VARKSAEFSVWVGVVRWTEETGGLVLGGGLASLGVFSCKRESPYKRESLCERESYVRERVYVREIVHVKEYV
jgi:hypothetical protein